MPLTRLAADAFGVVTICLVSILILLCLLCILYSIYFWSRIHREGYIKLGYFNGPWIIRISLILVLLWWCFGEIIRLTLFRGSGRVLHASTLQWQQSICKFYIVSNMGFAEPCLFFILARLLHASLQKKEVGSLSNQWNRKTFGYILLFCLPVFTLQLSSVLLGPKLNNLQSYKRKLPRYFTSASSGSPYENYSDIALCIYPLFSTILHGVYVVLLIAYLMYQGTRMISMVINRGLQRRVFLLIFTIMSFLPLRVLFLGFSVLSHPGYFAYEAVVFLAFVMFSSCAVVVISLLVYCPMADSLAVKPIRNVQNGGRSELEHGFFDDYSGTRMVNVSLLETSPTVSAGRNSDESAKGGSISFRTMVKDEPPVVGFEELSLFTSSSHRLLSPPGSTSLPGRPMIPLREFAEL